MCVVAFLTEGKGLIAKFAEARKASVRLYAVGTTCHIGGTGVVVGDLDVDVGVGNTLDALIDVEAAHTVIESG